MITRRDALKQMRFAKTKEELWFLIRKTNYDVEVCKKAKSHLKKPEIRKELLENDFPRGLILILN